MLPDLRKHARKDVIISMFTFDLSFNLYIYRCTSKQNYSTEGSIAKILHKSYLPWTSDCF